MLAGLLFDVGGDWFMFVLVFVYYLLFDLWFGCLVFVCVGCAFDLLRLGCLPICF